MAPLEVAAAGRPTIALRAGGALETIIDGVTGLFFDQPTVPSLIETIERFETLSWNQAVLRRHAEGFRPEVFGQRLSLFLSRIGAPLPSSSESAAALEVAVPAIDSAIAPVLKGIIA